MLVAKVLLAGIEIDSHVYDLPDFLDEGDLIIVNNTKVLPARIPVTRPTGGKGEIFLLHRIDDCLWNALVKPNAKILDPLNLVFNDHISFFEMVPDIVFHDHWGSVFHDHLGLRFS